MSSVPRGNATLAVDPSEYYVLVIANRGSATAGMAQLTYQFATYSADSPGALRIENLSFPAVT